MNRSDSSKILLFDVHPFKFNFKSSLIEAFSSYLLNRFRLLRSNRLDYAAGVARLCQSQS